ncbi:MAG: 50S ribosomal protein L2 [bacterium]
MPVKKYQPTTSGRRHASVLMHANRPPERPLKSLLERKRQFAGRNNQGKITVRHQGAGAKQLYRRIDFLQEKLDLPARVEQLEYDPNRTARIARIVYPDGERRYVLAPEGLAIGQTVTVSHKPVEIRVGNRTAIEHLPSGIAISNIELIPGHGGKIVRSAGSAATVMAVEGKFAQIKLPSGEIRLIPKEAMATIGQVSNADWANIRLGKAGRVRHYGIRPRVRGKVMNPVDHPHGGGEGKHPIGMKHPKTPWGKPALGVPTRKAFKTSKRFILKRRKG